MAIFADDHRYMARALQLARQGLYTTDPNPNVGCVLVNSAGDIVGEGFHQRAGELHAEPLAIADAGDKARGTTAYVTLEPCNHHGRTPPCAEALINAGITRVVAATQDPNPTVSGRGYEKLRAAGIQVDAGVIEADALELNRGYTQRMRHGRPWVRIKLAVSLDGRTALANGESQWITGEAARADVHSWRARSSVVMSGIGTVLVDDPALDARVDETVEQPKRLIVDSRLRTPADAKLLKTHGDVLLVYTHDQKQRAPALQAAGAELLRLEPNAVGRVPLSTLLDVLGEQGVNEVLVEAGPALSGALVAARLVNELIVYQAPVILGGDARGMFELPSLQSMADRYHLELADVRHVGNDLRMLYRCGEGVI